ncbi:MAG TPA: GerMN domain-containing protein [Firmicutes bacterium]|uniref:GerMN domain-containing protein n=1 Tax=Capillibacterium thermochitinicola TaxID=2699427 RepID=A0A8J6HZG0_9FIRM|nr:GerMN domain-containing protein [Capillibacterium thermochitinicola]MBA2131979.1 GerMN domain-containing protein [Capillibacterium thermochitinicola]HHW12573.1 GerMN domain-containing protein [Bacillota bacterium]
MKKLTFRIKPEWKTPFLAFAGGVVLTLLLGAYGFFTQRAQLQRVQNELATVQAQTAGLAENTPWKVALYFIGDEEGQSLLVPEVRTISPTAEPEMAALRELIKGPVTEGLQPVLPAKTAVRHLEIENGLAVVDLSREAVRIDRGSWGEALVVWSLVNTLTKFPEVEAVRILIEGQPVETLAGHFDLSRPLRRNEQVIRDYWTR